MNAQLGREAVGKGLEEVFSNVSREDGGEPGVGRTGKRTKIYESGSRGNGEMGRGSRGREYHMRRWAIGRSADEGGVKIGLSTRT